MRTTSANSPIAPEVKRHLIHDIAPFWLSLRDDEFGGFYGHMGTDFVVNKKADKGCILNSRILWFFSEMYSLCMDGLISETKLQDEGYSSLDILDSARHAFNFLKEYLYDAVNGGVYWSVTYDGKPSDTNKYTYNLAFAVYALVSYYNVSSDLEAIGIARKIKNVIELKCKDDIGYLESFDCEFNMIENDMLSENGVMAYRTTNTLVNIMEAYAALYNSTKDLPFKDKLISVFNMYKDKVYNYEKQRPDIFFDKDYNSIIDLELYGYDLEISWILDRMCDALGDEEMRQSISNISDQLVLKAYNDAFDGRSVAYECEDGVLNTARAWWVQSEAIIAFMNSYIKHPEYVPYHDAMHSVWNFVKQYMITNVHPAEWYNEVSIDGEVDHSLPIVSNWKCPYHVGRMCMEIIRRQEHLSEDL